ncbi:MAG TPA: sigma-70 family RNA polymerase sigma factor [Candidatus Acidoferrum sp.]|nr:sigma-70 family RNA polymerase sigma factor [Candidatus Acidoferrum sp.]
MCTTSISLGCAGRSALLLQARNGDRESLAKLILPYAPGMYLGALRLTGNPADAEDVRQEALLKAMSRLEQFAGTQEESRDDLHAWMSRIAANAAIDVIRKRRDGKVLSLEQPTGESEETLGSNAAAREDNPEERFARREMRKLMADAITQIAPELRQVCLLRDVLQYSTQEVAERLGISAMAVRLRLFRAHRRLREKLSLALQPSKQWPLRTTTGQIPCQMAQRKCERRVPLTAFAECACGD